MASDENADPSESKPSPGSPEIKVSYQTARSSNATPDGNQLEEERATEPTRRDALFWITFAGSAAVGGSLMGASILTGIKEFRLIKDDIASKKRLSLERDRQVKEVFFAGLRGEAPTVPGYNHKVFQAKNAVRPEDDISAIKSIAGVIPISKDFQYTDSKSAYQSPSGLIVAGSPMTNNIAHQVLAACDMEDYCIKAGDGHFYRLRFQHHMGSRKELVTRMLDRTWITEPNHQIVDRQKGRVYTSLTQSGSGHPLTSYLLFSKVPHPVFAGHTACVWAGNIGPGTEGVKLILDTDKFFNHLDLENLKDFAVENPYFQALFAIENIVLSESQGRHLPQSCRLVPNGLHAVQKVI